MPRCEFLALEQCRGDLASLHALDADVLELHHPLLFRYVRGDSEHASIAVLFANQLVGMRPVIYSFITVLPTMKVMNCFNRHLVLASA